MSLETLLKNFGDKKQAAKNSVAKVAAPVQVESIQSIQFESLTSESVCGKCGGKSFWRHKHLWYCGECKKPPTADFVHEVWGGERVTARIDPPSVAVDAYDSMVVAEEAGACSECPCRWVKETPQDNGQLRRVCYSCGATIDSDRHGKASEFRDLPFHLLPFWKWINEKTGG